MATTAAPTHTLSSLGQWVEKLYDDAFFQTNDEDAATTMNENFAQDFTATINHDRFSLQAFIEVAEKFRSVNVTTRESTKEIQSWDAPDGSGGGCVALLMYVKDINKETGVSSKSSTLLVANVQVVGGKKMLMSATEVLKQEE